MVNEITLDSRLADIEIDPQWYHMQTGHWLWEIELSPRDARKSRMEAVRQYRFLQERRREITPHTTDILLLYNSFDHSDPSEHQSAVDVLELGWEEAKDLDGAMRKLRRIVNTHDEKGE